MRFDMDRYEIVAPAVRNDGTPSDYALDLREGLLANGWDGWTEWPTTGAWRGKLEPGTTFVLYAGKGDHLLALGRIARTAMPDQEAVQVVRHPGATLAEA